MNQPALSIVVPVYNVADYLPQCLDSILAQDLSETEVILVDDGATDNSPEILAAYHAKHPELIVHRQENGGLSAARNTGMRLARGDYIAFLDSDDYIEPGYYTNLLNLARKHDLDMAIGNAWYDFEGRKDNYPIFQDSFPEGPFPGKEMLRQRIKSNTLLHMVWMHVYKRSFLEKYAMKFVPRIIHEDVIWTTRALLWAERVAYDPTPGLYYRQRIRNHEAEYADRGRARVIDSFIINAHAVEATARRIHDDDELRDLILWETTDKALAVFHSVNRFHSDDLAREQWLKFRREGLYSLIWRNAKSWQHRRRLIRNWIKSWWQV